MIKMKKLLKSKKAQSISINTIVVAAIALFVMALLIVIFVGNITNWRKNTDSCGSNGGTCIDADDINDDCSGTYDRVRRDYHCYNIKGDFDEDKVCCVST